MQIHRSGSRVKCEQCPRTIGIVNGDRLFVKAGDQVVVTAACSVICKCGYMNHVALQEAAD